MTNKKEEVLAFVVGIGLVLVVLYMLSQRKAAKATTAGAVNAAQPSAYTGASSGPVDYNGGPGNAIPALNATYDITPSMMQVALDYQINNPVPNSLSGEMFPLFGLVAQAVY